MVLIPWAKLKDFNKPPVIAMTAYVSEQDIKKCREAGFDDSYCQKPIDESALIEKILSFLPSVTTIQIMTH